MSLKTRFLTIALACTASAFSIAVACENCGGTEPALDGSADAPLDKVRLDVQSTPDAGDACVVVDSDWPGYQRYKAFGACARVDVPVDAGVLPALQWVTCKSGRPSCFEIAITWAGTGYGQFFGVALVGRDAQFKPAKLLLDIAPAPTQEETCLYDFTTLLPITSWRYAGNLPTDVGAWPRASANATALIGISNANAVIIGTGTLVDMLAGTGLSTMPTSIVPFGTGPQFEDISDTTFAFDTGGSGLVNRVAVGTQNYVVGHSAALLSRPVVHGDDVYAYANQGLDGWSRYYRVDVDGGVVDFANKPQHLISGLAADAVNVYWVDAYGAAQPTAAQPTTELWVAPYSADWTMALGGAQKLATISATRASNAVAFNGYSGWATRCRRYLGSARLGWCDRASDARTRQTIQQCGICRWCCCVGDRGFCDGRWKSRGRWCCVREARLFTLATGSRYAPIARRRATGRRGPGTQLARLDVPPEHFADLLSRFSQSLTYPAGALRAMTVLDAHERDRRRLRSCGACTGTDLGCRAPRANARAAPAAVAPRLELRANALDHLNESPLERGIARRDIDAPMVLNSNHVRTVWRDHDLIVVVVGRTSHQMDFAALGGEPLHSVVEVALGHHSRKACQRMAVDAGQYRT